MLCPVTHPLPPSRHETRGTLSDPRPFPLLLQGRPRIFDVMHRVRLRFTHATASPGHYMVPYQMLCLFSLDDVTNCSKLSRFARAGGPTPDESTFTLHHAPQRATGTCPAQYGRSGRSHDVVCWLVFIMARAPPPRGTYSEPGLPGLLPMAECRSTHGCRHQPAFNSAYPDPSWLAGR